MKKTGTLIQFLIMMVFFSAVSVYSQQDSKKTPEERASKISEKMKEKLTLTDIQKEQVYDILLGHMNEMKGLRNSTEDKTLKKEKIRSLRESTRNKINSVLSSDQQAKLEKFRQERKEKHKEWKSKKHPKQKGLK